EFVIFSSLFRILKASASADRSADNKRSHVEMEMKRTTMSARILLKVAVLRCCDWASDCLSARACSATWQNPTRCLISLKPRWDNVPKVAPLDTRLSHRLGFTVRLTS